MAPVVSADWNAESVAELNVTFLVVWSNVAVIEGSVVAGVPPIEKSVADNAAPSLPKI